MGDIQVAHRSFSQLTSWLSCGMQYRLERVEKVEQVPAWWFVGGKAVHTATENFDVFAEEVGLDKAIEVADDLWTSAWAEELAAEIDRTDIPPSDWRRGGRVTKEKPNKEDGAWWHDAGRSFLQAWIDFRQTYPNWKIATLPDGRIGIEPEFNVWFGEVPVRAFIDRVFEVTSPHGEPALVVVDLKTGSRMPKTPMQVGMYASILELAYGAEYRPHLGCFWDARKGDITVPELVDTFSVSMFTSMLGKFNTAVLNEIFIPNVGQSCSTCGVARFCPAVSGELSDQIAL